MAPAEREARARRALGGLRHDRVVADRDHAASLMATLASMTLRG